MAPSAKKAKLDDDGDPIPSGARSDGGGDGGGGDGDGKKKEAEAPSSREKKKKKSPASARSPRNSERSTPSSAGKTKKGPTAVAGVAGFGDDVGDYCLDSSDYDDYHDYDEYDDDEYDEYEDYEGYEYEEEDGKITSSTSTAKRAKAAADTSSPKRAKGKKGGSSSKRNGTTNGHHGVGGGSAAGYARGYPSSGDDYDDYEDEYDEEEKDGRKMMSSSSPFGGKGGARARASERSNGGTTANGHTGVGVASKAKGAVAAAASASASASAARREEIYISSGDDDYDGGGYDLFSTRRCAEYDRKSHSNVEDHERIMMMSSAAAKASSSPPSPISPVPRRKRGGAFFGGGGGAGAIDGSTKPPVANVTTREGKLALRRRHRAVMHRRMPDLEFLLTLDLEESYDNMTDGGGDDGGMMMYADEEEVAEELAGVAATVCRQTGVVVLRCGEKKRPASKKTKASASGKERDSKVRKGPRSSNESAKKASRSDGTGKQNGGPGEEASSSSASSLPPSSDDDDDGSLNTEDFFAEPGHLFSSKMLDELTDGAREVETEVCRRLDERHPGWRGTGGEDVSSEESKVSGKNNSKKRTQPVVDFRYHEVALRGSGRIDIRHRMDTYPFNHPAVVRNHLILPIVRDMLNGDANLVYAGLILSFPDSSDQPWHMDGRTLFPELDRDVPPYAVNVFVPLDDVSEELGPTELIPGSHTIDQAEVIDEAIVLSLTDGRDDDGSSIMYEMDSINVVAPLLQRGDALIYDYRVCHRGTGNLSPDRTRPMLYLMYARGWFREHVNFGTERLFVGQKQKKHVTV